jgi:hypothetical protein
VYFSPPEFIGALHTRIADNNFFIMDDATTAFATTCAVLAAGTGMLFCFAAKDPNAAVLDEEKDIVPVEETETYKEPVSAAEESAEAAPVLVSEEPAVVDASEETAATASKGVPEQRPTELLDQKTKKKGLSMRWRNRRTAEDGAAKTRTWLFRPKKTTTAGPEV